jgi:ADP-ribose pyrophosphatase YjhB (NUDIX family)
MLKKVLGVLWRGTPRRLRRFGSRVFQSRFTASAGAVILDESGRILLLKHVFRSGEGWGIPGGFINRGEQPKDALRREVSEETGIELESVELAFIHTSSQMNHLEIIFRCRAKGQTAKARGLEVNRLDWFALDQLPDVLGEDQRRIINRALKDGAND